MSKVLTWTVVSQVTDALRTESVSNPISPITLPANR